MPLVTSSFATLAADLKAAPAGPVFVLFSSTEQDGKKWCPGCIEIEPDVQRVFENGEHYALAVYLDWTDFDEGQWPQEAWALIGVPTVYRIDTPGAKPTSWLMQGQSAFGPALDAFVASPEAYEAFLEPKVPDYVDAATRWQWAHEDWQLSEDQAQARKKLKEVRDAVAAEQKKAREAARGAALEGEKAEEVKPVEGEKAEEIKPPAVCTGTTCVA
ncbi:hypothetical protein Q8F55_002660 [Vanrija albida]|uniref:Thioredoxin domain-containing protein n=1 Tax=Vanrija albida TaxID=181172 RepID=A0ABR3QAG2_9TREE